MSDQKSSVHPIPDVDALRNTLRGTVSFPGEATYAAQKVSWNFEYNDFKPLAIITCMSAWDVSHAIKYLRKNNLDFTVAGGRHTLHSIKTGIVMLDLSGLRSITIDPETQTGVVESGCRNRDVARECSLYNLHLTSGTNGDTGVGGLMLGGGWGYMAREYGLSLDSITGFELVTATGDIVHANTKENSELFVGMRGAGFNFGVVTKFFVKLHPIGHIAKSPSDPNADKVIGGIRIYPYAQAEHMWKTLRVTADPLTFDRRCTILQVLAHGPDGNPCTILAPAYTGRDLDQGLKTINEVVKFENTLVDAVRPMSYIELQDQLDAVSPPGHWLERGYMLGEMSDDFIRTAMAGYLKLPAGAKRSALMIAPFGGAIADVPPEASSAGNRNSRYWCVILVGFDLASRDAAIKWAEELHAALKPFSVGRYTNTLEGTVDTKLIYSSNLLTRLEALKAKWDPLNVFHHNHNIKPAAAGAKPAN